MWVGSEEDVPKRRGFQDGVDLRLGAMRRLSERERERDRQTNRERDREREEAKQKTQHHNPKQDR